MKGSKGHDFKKRFDKGPEHDENRPEVRIEGRDAAIRGTSVQPGEAGSEGTDRGGSVGLTESLDRYEDEVGSEGRRGGENYAAEDVVGGSEADEFDQEGSPRGRGNDW